MKALRRLGKTARTFLLVTLLGYDVDPKGSKLGVNEEVATSDGMQVLQLDAQPVVEAR